MELLTEKTLHSHRVSRYRCSSTAPALGIEAAIMPRFAASRPGELQTFFSTQSPSQSALAVSAASPVGEA
jgi:hypothetical protein